MKTELILARYNEDVSWIDKVDVEKITIYNKGEDNLKYKYIKLPNIGRESHTYLYHIIENYDNLTELTIFSQGDPFFHSPHFLKLIKNRDLFEPIQPLTAYYSPSFEDANNKSKKIIIEKEFIREGLPPKRVLDISKELWIKNIPIYVEYYDNNGVVRYPDFYHDFFITGFISYLKYRKIKFKSFTKFVKDRYKLNNIKLDELIPMSYAAIFAVKRNIILQRSKEFYINILNILLEDKEKYNIDSGLLLERLWLSIFNFQKYNKYYKSLKIKDNPIKYTYIPFNNNVAKFDIKTLTPIKLTLNIDDSLYTIIIGSNDIFFKKSYKLLTKNNFKIKIFNENKYYKIKITHYKDFNLFIDNQLILDYFLKNKKIKSIKIEESTYDSIII